eukprot:TRINITY_DN392_c0_g1_i1.p1 TRINITY_DN392_c0_g1~~TRINITY_DN392_c0_g1_i1.p1  ORF type:complete len:450 (-),score=80.74 TRINITY_DN392_c0_g1_i1:103-1452(-)
MDKLLVSIQTCDIQNEKELKSLRSTLNKSEEVLFKNLLHFDEILLRLETKKCTLAWIYILYTKAVLPSLDVAIFANQVSALIESGHIQQIRLAPIKFVTVVRRYMEILLDQGAALRAVRPLRQAIFKLRPNTESLTPLHADFLQVCLLAKDYRGALPILNEEVTTLADPDAYGFKPRDLLRFYYYSAMVHIGLKEFAKAIEALRQGLATPAVVLSTIMVESYKKYVLVSLLHQGTVNPLPKYTSPTVQRHLKSTCPVYQDFANAYGTNSTDEVHKVAAEHAEVFQKDNNFGLVKQCIQALYRSNIKRHTKTYLTLSLDQIAQSVKLANAKEAERFVLKMIESGEIYATINQKDGMVSFSDNPEQYNDSNMLNQLDAQIKSSISIAQKLREMDKDIAASTLYLQKTIAPGERHGRWDMEEFEMGGGPPGFQRTGAAGLVGRKGRKAGIAN